MNAKAELMPVEPQAVASVPAVMTPAHMLAIAVDRNADLDRIQQLMVLKSQWEADEARKSFNAALAAFKADPPKVVKDLTNSQYGSKYVSLGNLVNTVNAALGTQGLSASWTFKQSDKTIEVTCLLEHIDGHTRSVSLAAPPDTAGSKNQLQQIKSTITYLEGATFQAVTGIVSQNATLDDDGKAAAGQEKAAPTAPADYERWQADMTALADEGLQPLQAGWGRSAPDLRQYASMVDKAWWEATKAKARQVPA
jgi:hypothetical protein